MDLLLFNRNNRAWEAHVGVWTGDGLVLHLSAGVGVPATWTMRDFAARAEYRTLVGIKRARPAP